MLKTLRSIESTTWAGEGGVRVDSSSKAGRNGGELDGSKIDSNEIDSGKVGDDKIEKNVQKSSKFKNLLKFKKC